MSKKIIKIACIGWGSLIWRPEGLQIQNHWFEDGPLLPIEFTRISADNRVTLIIDHESKPVRTLWSLMTSITIEEAKNSLFLRERLKKASLIHSVGKNEINENIIFNLIKDWLKEKNLDYAVWTGLSYSEMTKKKRPSKEDILNHLKTIDFNSRINAEEYIRKAPRQIDTEYRRYIELNFNWTPI